MATTRQYTGSGQLAINDPVYQIARFQTGLWDPANPESHAKALALAEKIWAQQQGQQNVIQMGPGAGTTAAAGTDQGAQNINSLYGAQGQGQTPGQVPAGGATGTGTSGMDAMEQTYVDANGNTRKTSDNSLVSAGGDTSVKQQVMRPGYATQLGGQLAGFFGANLAGYQPGQAYGGQLAQTATPQEQAGLGLLDQYLSQGKGALTSAAEGEALKTLQGAYADPNTSPYIQSLMQIGQRNLQENIDALNRQRGALGRYFHTETLAGQNKLTQEASQDLNAQVSQWLEGERNRQTGMISTAADLDRMSQEASLQKVGASQTYGALQRQIEAQNLEKAYSDWIRAREEKSGLVSSATGLATDNPQYGFKTWYF